MVVLPHLKIKGHHKAKARVVNAAEVMVEAVEAGDQTTVDAAERDLRQAVHELAIEKLGVIGKGNASW